MTSSIGKMSALLALCAGNSPVTGEFPSQRPVTRNFDIFLDLRPKKRLSKHSWGWSFETPSHSLWRHCNALCCMGWHVSITRHGLSVSFKAYFQMPSCPPLVLHMRLPMVSLLGSNYIWSHESMMRCNLSWSFSTFSFPDLCLDKTDRHIPTMSDWDCNTWLKQIDTNQFVTHPNRG